ncbi:MAG: hypothetical protein ACRD2Q_04880 [Terriglobales bacterium]
MRRFLHPALLVGVAAALLLPVWTVRHPPLVDYPNHLARAFILAHPEDATLGRYYAADWSPNPYLLMDLALVALQGVMPVEIAGRVLLSVALLALPLCVWFFLKQVSPGHDFVALWSLLLCQNFFFLTGLVNLQLGIALCFLVLGLWLRWLERITLGVWVLLAFLATLLYFTHLMGFAVAALIATLLTLRTRRPRFVLYTTWSLFLPGALMLIYSRAGSGGPDIVFRSLASKPLVPLIAIESYSQPLDYATFAAVAVAIVAARWRNPEFRWNPQWLEVCLLLYLLYWILPFGVSTATYVHLRLVPFYWVAGLAAARIGRRAWMLAPVALLLFAVRTADMVRNFNARQPELDSFTRSFQVTTQGARVLPLVEWKGERKQVELHYSHFWAHGVIEKRWFTPYLFHDPGVHPLRIVHAAYAPAVREYLPTVYRQPPDWIRIQQDYDFIWAYNVPAFRTELSRISALVFEEGDLRVYRVSPRSPPSAGDPLPLRGEK